MIDHADILGELAPLLASPAAVDDAAIASSRDADDADDHAAWSWRAAARVSSLYLSLSPRDVMVTLVGVTAAAP